MVNIKLGSDTLIGVDTIKVENADHAGQYIDFKENINGNAAFDAFVEGKPFSAYGDALKIRSSAFYGLSVTKATFPECVDVKYEAFRACYNLSQANFSNCVTVGYGAFSNCLSLNSMSFPICTSISDCAFYRCEELVNVSLPNCVRVSSSAFYNCKNLETVTFNAFSFDGIVSATVFSSCSKLTSIYVQSTCLSSFANYELARYSDKLVPIDNDSEYAYPYEFYRSSTSYIPTSKSNIKGVGAYAFYSCSKLNYASLPECSFIGAYAFQSCKALTNVSAPNCKVVDVGAFEYCTSLYSVKFDECTYVGSMAFYGCNSFYTSGFSKCKYIDWMAFTQGYRIAAVSFPACEYVGSSAFYSCANLSVASFPVCSTIQSEAFTHCHDLIALYLNEYPSVCSLPYSNAFSYTPIGGYTSETGGQYGSVYVPASLVSNYKAANNWSYFADRIVGI